MFPAKLIKESKNFGKYWIYMLFNTYRHLKIDKKNLFVFKEKNKGEIFKIHNNKKHSGNL